MLGLGIEIARANSLGYTLAMTHTMERGAVDNCPPKSAAEASGKIFRFTNRRIPKIKDFYSYIELGIFNGAESMKCQAAGISVYLSEEAVDKARALVPALNKKHICSIDLFEGSFGWLLHTPSKSSQDHYTLWPHDDPEALVVIFSPRG